MELPFHTRPILSAMWRNKTGASLIALQIAVTLAVVVNALFIISGRLEKINLPVGSDTANLFSLQTVALADEQDIAGFMRADLQRIRDVAGVRSATALLHFLQGRSARADSYRAMPAVNDDMEVIVNINYSDEHGLETLGVELLEGRFFRADEIKAIDINYNGVPDKVIVTESLGRKFFPEGEMAGRTLYYDDDARPLEIIGVIGNVATAWLSQDSPTLADTKYNLMLHPYMLYEGGARYLVRAEAGLLNELIPQVEAALLQREPNRLLRSVYTQQEILRRSYSNDYATVFILVVVMVLMLIVTALGIVGLAAFSVRQRTRQIGTRRALGARKIDILRYFLIENLLLTTLGIILGAGLTYMLNYLLSATFGGASMDSYYFLLGAIILYLLGLAAAAGPATRATAIPPALATRSV
jgi:putative ABC transport system permease protein